ncbi:MAG: tetratricopeptide repeat protein [Gemmatimonadaceae bacterium]
MRFRSYLGTLIIAASALPVLPVVPALAAPQSGTARLASSVSGSATPRDSAIARLQSFLAEYPASPLRPNALYQLGELLVRRADDQFASAQRGASTADDSVFAGDAPIRPDYSEAIARYEELVSRFPEFENVAAAAYTLGTLYAQEQRHAEAVRMFSVVAATEDSPLRAEGFFRLGDAYFELAAHARGAERRSFFGQAAEAYEQAVSVAPEQGDIYFLSLYKLGWSYYNQASQTNQQEYRQAVETFGRLVADYDALTEEQKSRLGLRGEAIEYMAISFTQVGGAQAANQFFESHGGADYKLQVLARVAQGLRDQGDFPRAVDAYRVLMAEAPTDSAALAAQREIIDIFQNRMIEPDSAQAARLVLIERFAPGSAWAQANPGLADTLAAAREQALRQAGQYALAAAQRSESQQQFGTAAELYSRYVTEFPASDSAKAVNTYYAEALFGQKEFMRAGSQFSRAAFGYGAPDSLGRTAGLSAIVAFDSALARMPADPAAQDSLFAAVDQFVQAFPNAEQSKVALKQKARRASETERWGVLAETFRTYVRLYPDDSYTPSAQKLIGDALYKQGLYAEAQQQWDTAQVIAQRAGRGALADSISDIRTSAATSFADTLIQQGDYRRAAEEIYVSYADKNPRSKDAPGALRDAIETYMIPLADSMRGRASEDMRRQARTRAIELSERLINQYPDYEYRLQYQTLRANLLADAGRRDEAVDALRDLIRDNPRLEARDDLMVRLAVTLDSLGRDREAAAAFAEFSAAYPGDDRAADALFNAAVIYLEAGDTTASSRTYGEFAARYPRDVRAGDARLRQVAILRQAGDTAAASERIGELCEAREVAEALRPVCAERIAESMFRRGAALWFDYDAMELVISSRAQLTQAGVERASARKQRALREMTGVFTNVIETGNPLYLSAATYYVGLGQWEYGDFLSQAQLPDDLTEEERETAVAGARQQAEQFYQAARNTWQQLLEKAAQESIENVWVARARAALQGDIPSPPPISSLGRNASLTGEG